MQVQANHSLSLAVFILATLVLAPLAGCSSGEKPAQDSAAASQIPTGRFVGNVVETMDASGYTYVALARNGEQVWAAGPETELETGQEISIDLSMKMTDFTSEVLDRTFDAVYFVTDLETPSAASSATRIQDPHSGASRAESKPIQAIDTASIEKPADGYRVAELWEERTDLAGTEVVVRGRVVKSNPNVMNRNWLHLQDGTGDPSKGSHDLTVTSQTRAEVGDLVTIRGVVAVDRDFGSGYEYDLIVEKATVEVQ